jgi:hypothetical protein
MDPPWDMAAADVANEMVAASAFGADGAEMVVHRRFPADPPIVPPGWWQLGSYRYGDSILFRVANASAREAPQ